MNSVSYSQWSVNMSSNSVSFNPFGRGRFQAPARQSNRFTMFDSEGEPTAQRQILTSLELKSEQLHIGTFVRYQDSGESFDKIELDPATMANKTTKVAADVIYGTIITSVGSNPARGSREANSYAYVHVNEQSKTMGVSCSGSMLSHLEKLATEHKGALVKFVGLLQARTAPNSPRFLQVYRMEVVKPALGAKPATKKAAAKKTAAKGVSKTITPEPAVNVL